MTPGEIDLAAEQVIALAGYEKWDVTPAIDVGLGWLGDNGVVFVPGLPVAERVCFDGAIAQVQLRAGEPDPVSQWDCGHALGHVAAKRFGWGLEGSELEQACDLFAAAVLMPRLPYAAALHEFGEDWAELAVVFAVTETAAALRAGEVTGRPIAVVGPLTARGRGDATWTTEELPFASFLIVSTSSRFTPPLSMVHTWPGARPASTESSRALRPSCTRNFFRFAATSTTPMTEPFAPTNTKVTCDA